MCRASIYDARNNFSSLVKIAEGGEPVELTRHDKPVAVIISYEEYEKQKRNLFKEIEKLKKEYADALEGFEGFDCSDDGYPDEEYERKVDEMWGAE